ncbi:MAG: hypothetical protein ACM3X0_00080 [Bacteroidota bacterium]
MDRMEKHWLKNIAKAAETWEHEASLSKSDKALAKTLRYFAMDLYSQTNPSGTDLSTMMMLACHLCRDRSPEELQRAGCAGGCCALTPPSFRKHPYIKHLKTEWKNED